MTVPALPASAADLGGLTLVLGSLGAFFAGLAVTVAAALGVLTRAWRPGERIRRRLAPYAVPGSEDTPERDAGPTAPGVLGDNPLARSAVDAAERVVTRRGLDTLLATRLEGAGLPLRPAEWFVLHVVATVGAALLFTLLAGGSPGGAGAGLVLGLAGPWVVLTLRQGRREAAFLAQLPDTLQLLASSLRAGYSLPQAIDTAVRRGDQPMAGELNRALVEHRLGLSLPDALEAIGARLRSDDFSWVVMAIRIQSDVGGNLAELLTTVSGTLRERERLRRQVSVLSAEGRLSGIILGILPVVFAAYLLVRQPSYLARLGTPFGLVLVVVAVLLLAVGSVWIARTVKVEV